MKRILAVIMCVVLLFGMLPVFASGDVSETGGEVQTQELTETEQTNKTLSITITVSAVIGALLAVTLLYKKKDELRYL